jgi:hypothetical protein
VLEQYPSSRAAQRILEESDRRAEKVSQKASPAPQLATIELIYKNRLSRATISLRVDDQEVWSERLTSKNVLKRISGDKLRRTIPISAGHHTISVSITGESMKVEARKSIEAKLRAGETRHLQASLNPYTDKLKLSWVHP